MGMACVPLLSRAPVGDHGGTASLHAWIRTVLPTGGRYRAEPPAILPVHPGAPVVTGREDGEDLDEGLRCAPSMSFQNHSTALGGTAELGDGEEQHERAFRGSRSSVSSQIPVGEVCGAAAMGARGSGDGGDAAASGNGGEIPSLFCGGLGAVADLTARVRIHVAHRSSILSQTSLRYEEVVGRDGSASPSMDAEVGLGEEPVSQGEVQGCSRSGSAKSTAAGFGGRFWC